MNLLSRYRVSCRQKWVEERQSSCWPKERSGTLVCRERSNSDTILRITYLSTSLSVEPMNKELILLKIDAFFSNRGDIFTYRSFVERTQEGCLIFSFHSDVDRDRTFG